MTALLRLSWVLLILGFVGFWGTLITRNHLVGQGELTQLVNPADPAVAALTGEVGAFVGEPQYLILTDPKAILPERGPNGERLADRVYMREQGIYLLQTKMVVFVGRWTMVGFVALMLVSLGGILVGTRRLRARA